MHYLVQGFNVVSLLNKPTVDLTTGLKSYDSGYSLTLDRNLSSLQGILPILLLATLNGLFLALTFF